jgi:hypothetical protein
LTDRPDCGCNRSTIFPEACPEHAGNQPLAINNRNTSFNPNGRSRFCFHLGVLLYAPFFNKLSERGLHYVRQWLAAILLGCQNIEQSKELNYNSLQNIIGKAYKTLHLQRIGLKDAATRANTESIMQFNAEMLEVTRQRDFYYDPHTKHYTGHLKILSTWCPSVRLADKGINMDYIHTSSGQPVYFNTTDNFYDLRERFMANIASFRSLFHFDDTDVLTWIIDRGIYSIDVFKQIVEDPYSHIVTWEKGYEKNKWDENDPAQKGCLVKKRNHKKDLKLVHYRYQEKLWEKDASMRQIIVRILDKNWEVLIEVSILTDDQNRPADQVIELMLKRWVQENDFKYMMKHFGVNQLTSYAFTDYKALKDKIEDKLYTCQQHKGLTQEIQKVRDKLKTALLRRYNFEEKYGGQNDNLPVKQGQRKQAIEEKIKTLSAVLSELEQQRSATAKQVSKVDELIEQDYQKLDTNTKDFMDAIKMLARNIFYLTFLPFKEKYNNYRDDHVLFRHLTRSGGQIQIIDEGFKIQLRPQMEYQPKIQKIINEVLDEINQKQPKMPDGSGRKIQISLKSDLRFKS